MKRSKTRAGSRDKENAETARLASVTPAAANESCTPHRGLNSETDLRTQASCLETIPQLHRAQDEALGLLADLQKSTRAMQRSPVPRRNNDPGSGVSVSVVITPNVPLPFEISLSR